MDAEVNKREAADPEVLQTLIDWEEAQVANKATADLYDNAARIIGRAADIVRRSLRKGPAVSPPDALRQAMSEVPEWGGIRTLNVLHSMSMVVFAGPIYGLENKVTRQAQSEVAKDV